jgi:dihydrofolate reductase
MHLVRYHVAVSIDGFIAPRDGSTDWLDPYGEIAMGFIGPWMKRIGGIIVGRETYHQSTATGGWMWGETPALVMASRPLPATVEASDDPMEGLRRLRSRMPEGNIWLFGGGVTAGAFLKAA